MEICECGKTMQKYMRANSKQDLYDCECGKTRLVNRSTTKKKYRIKPVVVHMPEIIYWPPVPAEIEPVLQDHLKYKAYLTGKAAIDDV